MYKRSSVKKPYRDVISNKFELLLAKTKISNVLKRNIRKRKVSPASGAHSNIRIPRFITNFFILRRNFLQKFLLMALILIVVFLGVAYLRQCNSIKITPYLVSSENSEESSLRPIGYEYNVLVAGFEKSQDNRFAEMILLISLNTKTGSLKLISVNPMYITPA